MENAARRAAHAHAPAAASVPCSATTGSTSPDEMMMRSKWNAEAGCVCGAVARKRWTSSIDPVPAGSVAASGLHAA